MPAINTTWYWVYYWSINFIKGGKEMKKIILLGICLGMVGFSQTRSINWTTENVVVTSSKTIYAPYQYSGFWFQTREAVTLNLKGVNYFKAAGANMDLWPLNFKKDDTILFPTQDVTVNILGIWYENNE